MPITGPSRRLLYQLVEAHYSAFVDHLAARERSLPAYVQREFEDYLKCGRLEHAHLTLGPQDESGFDELLSHSITYRIALGP